MINIKNGFGFTQLERGPFYDTMLNYFDFKIGDNLTDIDNSRVLELFNKSTVGRAHDTIIMLKKPIDMVKVFPKIL